MSFPQKLRTFRKRSAYTQEALAKELGIGRGRLAKYEEGRAEPPLELLKRIVEFFDRSLDELLEKEAGESKKRKEASRELRKRVDPAKGGEVEVIPGEATAGYLSGYGDPEYLEQLERIRIPFLPSGKLRAFPVRGDSMLPVKDGSYVIGRYIDESRRIRDGRTYIVVSRNEGVSYKRVWNDVAEDGSLLLVPDNKWYRPYRVDADEILELWEYVGHLSLSEER
ncbi:MAG: XRE family transcriptional regulator [Flavobacteriales bacterium]